MEMKRGLIFLILTILQIVWLLAAIGTDIFKVDPEPVLGIKNVISADMWYTCSRRSVNGDESIATCSDPVDKKQDCTKLKDRVRAIRAFHVFTAIFVIANITIGVMDFFGVLNLPFGLKPQIALISLAGCVIAFSLLSWALSISYPRTKYCNDQNPISDANGFKWAASPFMMLMLWITAIVQLVLAIIFPGGASDKSASDQE